MDKQKLKKIGIWSVSVLAVMYILFLLLPFAVSPIVDSYSDKIEDLVTESTGLKSDLDNISVVTRPNLSAGIKVQNFTLSLPDSNAPFFVSEDISVRLALLPLMLRRIQLDYAGAESVHSTLEVKNDGQFLVMDYLPKAQKDKSSEQFVLPWGFKLSNRLPDVKVNSYKFAFVDTETSKSYYTDGEKFKITDFVLDKKFKFSAKGKIVLDDMVASNYNLKIKNNIMPDIQLDDIVFPKESVNSKADDEDELNASTQIPFNIIDVFKAAHNNRISADLTTDIKTSGSIKEPQLNGYIKTDALSVAVNGKKLPESYAYLTFKGHHTDIDSMFFTSEDEKENTQVIGSFQTGKKPSVDITLRSNAKINNIIRLIDSIASSFGIEDFKTLSATGGIDADFNINSDMKKVTSTGYMKVLPSRISYGLYNISVDDIVADIDFMNNNINIKKSGFSVLGHPLKLSGTISHDASLDLSVVADKLSLKGLLAAFGQIALLKENEINGGTVSVNAEILGKLNNIKPEVSSSVSNVNVLNKASGLKIVLKDALLTLLYDGKAASGDVNVNSLSFIHPMASVSVPKANILIDEKDINIKDTYIALNNSRVDLKGSVTDYIQDKMSFNITANGNVESADLASFIPKDFKSLISYKGSIPITATLSGNSKVQYIKFNMDANKDNYLSLLDIDLLKNQKTKLHSSIEIIGDTLNLTNTGISTDKSTVAKVTGDISKLYSKPQLNLNIAVPSTISFPIWGVPTSNITANGSVSVLGNIINPQIRGTVNIIDLSIKNMDFAISDLVADLSGYILNGSATARQFKFGGIVAEDLAANFKLNNYNNFILSDISAKSFDGDVNGNFEYIISSSKINTDIKGSGLNSTKAIDGAVGIKNALTGDLDFTADLSMQGLTDKEIIQSMKGNIDFNIADGRFVSIGKLENLVAAQNVSSNSVLKSVVSALSTVSAIQEADKYKYIKGNLSLSNGSANISKILVAGPLMAYYVNGVYNILPNTANLTILGRLDAKVVSLLGPLGELSADKLLSYIPKFGALTSNILKQLTSDPANENTALIPALTGGSTSYKDFKVLFSGPVSGAASVRSFKWLSQCDTSEMNLKKDLENAKDAVKTNINTRVEQAKTNAENIKTNVNNIIENQKTKVESVKKDIEQTKTDIQNAKENAKNNSDNVKNLLLNAIKNSQKQVAPSANTSSETSIPASGEVQE